jgi:hypothetical protein
MSFAQLNHDLKVVGEETKRLRTIVSDAYEKLNKKFCAIPDIRFCKDNVLRRRWTDGTLFQPAVTALQQAGINIPRNIGGLMTALELEREDVLDIASDCGCAITSQRIAEHFHKLAESA